MLGWLPFEFSYFTFNSLRFRHKAKLLSVIKEVMLRNICIINNSKIVILLSCERKKLTLTEIVFLKHYNLRETKNNLHVTDFYIKLAEELEVNFYWQNDPNCITPAVSILRLNCLGLETTLGPEVTSLWNLGAIAATEMARGPRVHPPRIKSPRDSWAKELPHQSPP